jgi:hypothetical protein
MFLVWRRNNEKTFASRSDSRCVGQQCWLRLLSLLSAAHASAVPATLCAGVCACTNV